MVQQSEITQESMLIRQRYKVVHVLEAWQDYALLEAVDIAERETPNCLLNLYGGALLHRYGTVFSSVKPKDCPGFRGAFMESGTLVAVFDDCRGKDIDASFFRGDGWKWQGRMIYAELVLHQALVMANLPPEISCPVMLTENLLVDVPDARVRLRFAVRPMEGMNARELALLTGDQVRKILPDSLMATDAETEFQRCIDQGECRSVVALYAAWRRAQPLIVKEREEYEGKSLFPRLWTLVRRFFKRRKKNRRGGRV